MYYPQEVIDQVIAANDIVDVIGQHVHLKKGGSNYMGLCPFHNEKSPSFSVSGSKQMFYCFGCGEGGNVISFMMKYENYSFPEALKVLADRAGIKLPEAEYSEQQKMRARKRDELLAINKEAATYYFKLLRSPKGKIGMDYLTKRQLSPETLTKFGLGYADGAKSDLTAFLRKKGFSDENILDAGVAVYDEKRGLHDRFFNRVMYPIMDATNRVIGFGGRVMGDAKPKYLNSPETPVFDKSHNLYGLNIAKRTKAPYFILCEGYMDVIAMHQAGFDMAVASLGTAFTEGQANIIKRYVKNVMLDYDSDGAGVTAAMRNMEILRKVGINVKVVDMRPAKDADEFMKTEGLGPEEFKNRIKNAENSFFYRVRHVQEKYDMSDPSSQTQFYHEIAKMLCSFEDEFERENYIKAMAEQYMIPVDTLRREVASYDRAGGTEVNAPIKPQETRNHPQSGTEGKKIDAATKAQEKNERLLLTWLSDDPDLYPQLMDYISAEDFEEGIYREAAGAYLKKLSEAYGDPLAVASGNGPKTRTNPASVIGMFQEEEDQRIAASLFEERITGVTSVDEREKALKDVIMQVKRVSNERLTAGGDLNQIIKAKKQLDLIQKTRFTVHDSQ